MKRLSLFLLAFAIPLAAQVPTQIINPCLAQGCFFATVTGTVAMSATSKLTIQQPATGGRQVAYIAAIVQCAGQTFTIDQSQNGTAASTTLISSVAMIPNSTKTAGALAYSASNVGAGTAVAPTLAYVAGNPQVIDLSQRTTGLSGTTNNYTVTMTNTGSGSCTGTVSIYWSEKQ